MRSPFLNAIALFVSTAALFLVSASASANPQLRDYPIEFRVSLLERQVSEMNRTMLALQKRVEELAGNPPAPPVEIIAACMITDSTYSRTFLGVAKNKIDAEYNARNACQVSLSSTNLCGKSASLKCDDNSKPNDAHGFICMVTDSAYSKNFRGTGRTPVEAEAKAKQACQNSAGPSNCGPVAARCAEQF
ncbi:MAG: hypothetical protein ACJ763_18855 [Bdellovibrionia bacterium]